MLFYYLSATKKLLILQLQIFQIIFSQAFLSLFFISILQILVELKFSSFAGVITAFSYYIVSTILGGYFIEKEQYFPLLFLTTNFSMKNRTDLISADFVDLYILYLILAFAIIVCIFLCRKIIKQKDIF